MADELKPCCPHCYSDDFQPAMLYMRSEGLLQLYDSQQDIDELLYLKNGKSLALYHGEELYHCNDCGTVFEHDQAVELRELDSVEPPLSLSFMFYRIENGRKVMVQ